jgi:hypothetical protein
VEGVETRSGLARIVANGLLSVCGAWRIKTCRALFQFPAARNPNEFANYWATSQVHKNKKGASREAPSLRTLVIAIGDRFTVRDLLLACCGSGGLGSGLLRGELDVEILALQRDRNERARAVRLNGA